MSEINDNADIMESGGVINLGEKVKDKITGFEGVAIAKCIYLNGCICYEIQPKCNSKDKMPQSVWIDEQQLEEVTKEKSKIIRQPKTLWGGLQNRPTTKSVPRYDRPYRGQGYNDIQEAKKE